MSEKTNLANGVVNIDYDPSEGERYIAQFLKNEKIKFEQEVPIVNLRNDSKSHRRADFYLTDYKVYIEFFGRWNNTKEDRITYRDKKGAYFKNNIPCVYIYPENLGILEFSLFSRLEKLLIDHNLKKELFKFRLNRFTKHYGGNVFWFILITLLVVFDDFDNEVVLFYIFLAVFSYQTYKLVSGILEIFFPSIKKQ
jgi:hypothetical protein